MRLIGFLLALVPVFAQPAAPPSPLLNNNDALRLYTRALQLMESTGVAVPELSRAGAPLIESCKQALADLRITAGNAALQYTIFNNVRAYLYLADSVSKPYPFPEAGQKQFDELCDSVAKMDAHFRALIAQKDRQLRTPDPDNLARYAELDTRVGPPQPGRPRIVFMGDSITDAWRLNEYFPDRDFINRGISGQVTNQMLARMRADVIDLHPAAMIVLGGTNDIARGTPLSVIENNLTLMADLADHFKIKLILSTVLPVSSYHKDVNPAYDMTQFRPPDQIRSLNNWIQEFCTQRNYTFLDYYSATVDASGQLKAELADDGLHPNGAGYRIMAPLALDAINKAIRQPAPAPTPVPQKPRRRGLFSSW